MVKHPPEASDVPRPEAADRPTSVYVAGSAADAPLGPVGLTIAAVERDTGIAKETLRVWERRYGFPTPARDALGERVYPPEQVKRLRLVRRLLDAGHRPGRVVAASDERLATLVVDLPPAAPPSPSPLAEGPAADIEQCLQRLRAHDIEGLRRTLGQGLLRYGLGQGVTALLAPLTVAVGEAWMRGELQVFEEHIYSESLQLVLRQAIQALPSGDAAQQRPRVLLTTLPGEPHALGLLMAEALLTLEGCACLSLGAQTPIAELPAAVAAHRADVVALSFTSYPSVRDIQQGLQRLREQLPASIEIWAGGSNRALRPSHCPAGVRGLPALEDIATQLAQWRAAAAASAQTGS